MLSSDLCKKSELMETPYAANNVEDEWQGSTSLEENDDAEKTRIRAARQPLADILRRNIYMQQCLVNLMDLIRQNLHRIQKC